MSTATDASNVPPEADEDLVAYLDGELGADATRRVEERLALDAQYRQELARLQRAWDCLDELPTTRVDESFTRNTIQMVAQSAEQELAQTRTALPRQQRLRRARFLSLIAGSLVVGFLLASVVWPNPSVRLARDLPVLANLDLYLPVENIEYLRLLASADVLPEVDAADGPAAEQPLATVHVEGLPSLADLSAAEKTRLATNERRFSALPHAERERVRELVRDLDAAPDAPRLRATLVNYHAWLKARSPGEQADLAGLSGEARMAEVKKLVAEDQRRELTELSSADRAVVAAFLEEYLFAHREELIKDMPKSPREDLLRRWQEMEQKGELGKKEIAGGMLMMLWQKSRYSGQGLKLPLDDAELRRLSERMSPIARAQLAKLEGLDSKRRLLTSWFYLVMRQRIISRYADPATRQVSQEQLEQYFAEHLSSDERARLLAQPAAEMDRELRRMVLEEMNRERGHNRPGGGKVPYPFNREGRHGGRTGEFSHGGDHRPEDGPPRPDGPPREGRPHDGPRREFDSERNPPNDAQKFDPDPKRPDGPPSDRRPREGEARFY